MTADPIKHIKRDIVSAVSEVRWLAEAEAERDALPKLARQHIDNAVAKLRALGDGLPSPHSSAVKGWPDLRELRPLGGRSPWRPVYRKVSGVFVVAAIAPEGKKDRRRFDRACAAAVERLAKVEEDGDGDSDVRGHAENSGTAGGGDGAGGSGCD